MPPADRGVQSDEGRIGGLTFPQEHFSKQLRLRGIGQQVHTRFQAGVFGGDPKVEQRCAATEMQASVRGVAARHRPFEIGEQLQGAVVGAVPETPRLSVVHGRGGGRITNKSRHGRCVQR
ncbi:hypothetical protein GCM10010361_10610 [Streptomyces olivaceiscleroticus]|uniref:Uncharacterized protein n=1 Tax=Streptomyces olivaceiscleroticus TaxID=68245 RepID=A0ABN0ZIU9_9ACTN